MIRRPARESLVGASVASAALVAWFLLPSPASGSLVGPSGRGLAVGRTEVVVRVASRLLFFDHDGGFRRELTLADLPLERAQVVALTDDGRLWLEIEEEDESGKRVSTTVVVADESGAVVARHRLTGDWMTYVNPAGSAYVGRAEAKRLRIERLDGASGRHTLHVSIPIDAALRVLDLDVASAVSWAVDEQGDVFVLTTAREKGRVSRHRPSGEWVASWEVVPDPVTSVSYMKKVLLDREGVPYVTHSSWEVSSSTANDGSVLRLDPSGGEALRIKEGIGYLRHVAVSPSGDVFVSDLSDRVHRFSPEGEPVLSWVAVPPRFGESWEERRERMLKAGQVGPSATIEELVLAVVYGEGDRSPSPARWLLEKGPQALPEVTKAVLRFRESYPLGRAAEQLWKAHPPQAAQLFEEARDEPVRRVLAPFLAWNVDAPPPGVREVLAQMVLEGDGNARHALNHLGPTPEVVQANVAALRRARKKGESSFDAEWDLRQSYPWSIGALEAILVDPADPDRRAVRSLVLEASRELATDSDEEEKPAPIRADIVLRTRSWVAHRDPFVRDAGAIALTSFGVVGHEPDAVRAAGRSRDLLVPALQAFAVLAAVHPDRLPPYAESLARLARAPLSPEEASDPLTELAQIPHPAFAERCLRLLADESLSAERRGAILLGLRPSALARPALLELLREQTWQRSLSREYFYYSFLEDVAKAYPEDAQVRAEARNVLLGLLSDEHRDRLKPAKRDPTDDIDALAMAISSLRPLVDASDLPRLLPLLDDPGLDRGARAQLLSVLSRVSPDDELRERLVPLLKDPDHALAAAQSLGRVGHPGALEVLVEQGLKRLGFYSAVDLDLESFWPFGPDAEQALLSLVDYPNTGTRQLVRRFLVQWPSAEGRRRIRAELDAAIESGRAPEAYTLSALALAGEALVEPLLKLAAAHPEAIEMLATEPEEGALGDQLRKALAEEPDPVRARNLGRLLRRLCSCGDDGG